MTFLLKTCLTLLFVFGVLTTGHAQTEAEERKIRATVALWEHAWNNHDMKALAALFTDDADFVNVGARHWKGRTAIQAQHASRLEQFIESVWTTKGVTVQFLKPDLALAHITWGMRGDKDPDGTPRQPRDGLFTWVVVRQRGHWLVRAAQNTNPGSLPSPPIVK
jgi:uncharacterized protein (TIGR02246 family)